jgi:hypothetical protein
MACTPIARARLPRGRRAVPQDTADLKKRVARLEKLLSTARIGEEPFEPIPPNDNNVTSNTTWNIISEEVVGIRELLDQLTGDEPNDPIVVPPDVNRIQTFDLLLYSDASCFIQPSVLESPPIAMVTELVDVYLYRIDQVIKVTHTPSLRAIVLELDTITPAQEALRFAVLFAALNSLDEQECLQRFKSSKTSLSSRFQLAAEVLLSRAGLLITTDLVVLQAFVIYLVR